MPQRCCRSRSLPAGTDTVFVDAGGLATVVPGGQQAYAMPTGELLFTAAHANLVPDGAVRAPFVYVEQPDAQYGTVTTYAFGADGFMACPTHGDIAYQVFINIPNAVVPLGDVTTCVPVSPLAVPYTEGTAAAWQYN